MLLSLTEEMENAGITTHLEWAATNPSVDGDDAWNATAFHYTVIFKRPGKEPYRVPFSTGNGWDREPTGAEVMRCLLLDVSTLQGCMTFEDWASELGFDPDSRSAEKTFNTIVAETEKLTDWLCDYDGHGSRLDEWLDSSEVMDSEDKDVDYENE